MSDNASNGSEQCHRCEERAADVIPESSDPPLCQQCVREIMRESAKEGERGQGQRPIGEQNAVNRHTRYPSSREVGRDNSSTGT